MSWIDDLAKQWGNPKFAAPIQFAEAIEKAWGETEGVVLECGSGFTTLVLDELSGRDKRYVVTLESHPHWFKCATKATKHVNVMPTSLADGWYDLKWKPANVGLVVVDGPCGNRAGVMSLAPSMRDDVLILVDDATRDRKQIEKWATGWNVSFSREGRGIARIRRANVSPV